MRMPRKLLPNASYHVVARANRNEFIFAVDAIKELFLTTITRAKRRYSFSISNFCIMGNHFHILIRPAKSESLSRIMQWILSVFAVAYNKLFGHSGHVWYDRFKSRVINSYRQWVATFEYIVDNPIRAGMAECRTSYYYGGTMRMRNGDFSVVDRPSDVVTIRFPRCATLCLPGGFLRD